MVALITRQPQLRPASLQLRPAQEQRPRATPDCPMRANCRYTQIQVNTNFRKKKHCQANGADTLGDAARLAPPPSQVYPYTLQRHRFHTVNHLNF